MFTTDGSIRYEEPELMMITFKEASEECVTGLDHEKQEHTVGIKDDSLIDNLKNKSSIDEQVSTFQSDNKAQVKANEHVEETPSP